MLLRKLRSFFVYLKTPANLWPAVLRNGAVLRARLNGRGSFTYRSPLGIPFVCYPENATSLRLFVKGYQEVAEIQLAAAWLRPGESCVDVGANIGLLSVAFANAVGPGGGVLAIEPSPAAFACLSATLRTLNLENVLPVACCASNDEGLESFYIAAGGAAEPEEESMRIAAERTSEFRETLVPTVQLSSLCQRLEPFAQPALIKIDVEGAEPLVLEGASQLLQGTSPPLVICEIHRTALANYDFRPDDVLSHFPRDRYDLYFIPRSVSDETEIHRHGRVYRLESAEQLPIYSNAIAIPHDSARRADMDRVLHDHAG